MKTSDGLGFDPDFDFSDFDSAFESDPFFTDGWAPAEPRQLDLHSIVMTGERPARVFFSVAREAEQAGAVIEVPGPGERIECISGRLGFSSIAVIELAARSERIDELHVATFNVSRKRMGVLERLHREGRIGRGFVVTSDVKAGRDPYCREACERMGWDFREARNHAKLILMRTASGFHCVRTSSNLNENPRIETYTWDNDEETYTFYRQLFDALADV